MDKISRVIPKLEGSSLLGDGEMGDGCMENERRSHAMTPSIS